MDWGKILPPLLAGALVALVYQVGGLVRERRKRRKFVTARQCQEILGALRGTPEPAVRLTTDASRASGALDTRFGGRPWSPEETPWPVEANGAPYLFLAQINFAQMPRLPDFPESGLLQIFVPTRDGAMDWPDPTEQRHLVRWYPDPYDGTVLPIPHAVGAIDGNPFPTDSFLGEGLAVDFRLTEMRPMPNIHQIRGMIPYGLDLQPENRQAAEALEEIERVSQENADHVGTHWIGGHPLFEQYDIRIHPDLAGHDVVLLHIGSDDEVCIGDMGFINILIRSDDLRAQRFYRTAYAVDFA